MMNPGAAGVGGPPDAPPPVVPGPPGGPERSSRRVVGVLVSVFALVVAGVFAITWMTGGDDGGTASGAESPEELGERALDVVANGDVLGGIELLLPGERETFRQPMIDLVDELERLEILDGVDLSGVPGFDVELADREVEVEETNVDDVVHITISGTAAVQVNAEDFPLGDIVRERLDDAGVDLEADEADPVEEELMLPLTGVQQDGEWYLSLGYTVAEAVRSTTWDEETGEPFAIPAEGVAPAGAESPEGVIDLAAQAATDLDVEAMIALLNPDEAAALQRYAPIFLGDVELMVEDSGYEVEIEITDIQTTVDGSGSRREVFIDGLSASMTVVDEWSEETMSVEYADECVSATYETSDGEEDSVEYCLDEMTAVSEEAMDELLEELPDPDQGREFFDSFNEAFADFETPGIVVVEVDGEWYLSPIATGSDALLAVLQALDADELDELIDQGGELFEQVVSQFDPMVTDDWEVNDDWLEDDEGASVPASTPED